MYYEKLEETDKKIEAIDAWQKKKLIKLFNKTEKKLNKVFAKLGKTIPEEVKGVRLKHSSPNNG
jgi:restriction endonuclease S subunit